MNPKRSYQETAVRGANPVRLTILLYDQLIQDVSRASESLAAGRIEPCAQEIGHAIAVIGYLQATLRHKTGHDVARNLSRFYTMLRERLMEAQVRSSIPILDDLRQQLTEVREAWVKVEAETIPARQ
ncbi:MAG TPA: flagellar export chaperone FliS [Terriglobales bacterium]|jgi:flagellar biosynthetic protein FliS|nr:flagellar export chaperone FliS [Terriglobales bacterium]